MRLNLSNYEPVTFSEMNGVRYLHLGTPWVQGAMRIKKPHAIELEYAQQMMSWLLFLDPSHAKTLQLGLGTGTLTNFTQRLNSSIHATAVELNPAVIVAAQTMFSLDPHSPQIDIVHANALDFVMEEKNHHRFDSLQVDIFNGEASGPALSSLQFYQSCFNSLKETGVMTVNLFSRHESFPKNINHICDAFNNRVLLFKEVHDCNVIAIAFKGPPLSVSWSQLKERAEFVRDVYKLPTKKWVKHLKKNNVQPKDFLVI
jgi:spermidine synthase